MTNWQKVERLQLLNKANYLLVFVIIFLSQLGTTQSLSENSYIALLTEGPGEEMYSGYGHTAIRVRDDAQNLDVVYHYGLFDFDAPGFYPNFLKGKLNYKMGGQYFSSFYSHAKEDQRYVIEQILNLNTTEKNELYRLLNINYLPENRAYWYDFFFDNCSTKPRDLFEKVWGDKLRYKEDDEKRTFRQLLHSHQRFFPWMDLGNNLMIGTNTDREISIREEFFLPIYMKDHLNNSTVGNEPAILKENRILDFPDFPLPKFWNRPIFIFLILLLLELFISYKWYITKIVSGSVVTYDRLWFLVAGLLSLALLFLWFGTEHYSTKFNWNVLWASPLFLWPAVVKLRNPSKKTALVVKIIMSLLSVTLLDWLILPQPFHITVFPIVIILLLKCWRYINYSFKTTKDT